MSYFSDLYKLAANNHKAASVSDLYKDVINLGEYVAAVKDKNCNYLSVAGLIGAELKAQEISLEKAKEFVRIALENPECVTAQWMTLPWLFGRGEFYNAKKTAKEAVESKIKSREYYEAAALMYLIASVGVNEEDLYPLSDLVDKGNKERQEEHDAKVERAKKLADLF